MAKNLGLFYNKQCLQDTLIGIINDVECVRTVNVAKHVIFFDKFDEIIGFNIINAGSLINHLPEGFIYPNLALITEIEKILGIHLSSYLSQKNFVIGEVVDYEPISGTHLRNCKINVGSDTCLSIVCGANNFHRNVGVVVALDGSVLPNGKIIKKRKIHGDLFSEGMLCSYQELNLPYARGEERCIICLPLDDNENKVGSIFLRPYVQYVPRD